MPQYFSKSTNSLIFIQKLVPKYSRLFFNVYLPELEDMRMKFIPADEVLEDGIVPYNFLAIALHGGSFTLPPLCFHFSQSILNEVSLL